MEAAQADKQNVVHPYSGIYSVLKRKEILTHAAPWMNLEDMMLSEISQSQKDKYCIVLNIYMRSLE